MNPTDYLVNEKSEYTGPLSTNTPVDDKGELVLPPVINELPEYKGGTNPADAPINEKPEYNGGVNSIEPPVNEKPEYTSPLSTNTPVDDNGKLVLPPIVDKLPEYKEPTLEIPDLNTNKEIIKSEIPKEETSKERELPNTNSGSILASLVSSIIGTLGLGYKKRK